MEACKGAAIMHWSMQRYCEECSALHACVAGSLEGGRKGNDAFSPANRGAAIVHENMQRYSEEWRALDACVAGSLEGGRERDAALSPAGKGAAIVHHADQLIGLQQLIQPWLLDQTASLHWVKQYDSATIIKKRTINNVLNQQLCHLCQMKQHLLAAWLLDQTASLYATYI